MSSRLIPRVFSSNLDGSRGLMTVTYKGSPNLLSSMVPVVTANSMTLSDDACRILRVGVEKTDYAVVG